MLITVEFYTFTFNFATFKSRKNEPRREVSFTLGWILHILFMGLKRTNIHGLDSWQNVDYLPNDLVLYHPHVKLSVKPTSVESAPRWKENVKSRGRVLQCHYFFHCQTILPSMTFPFFFLVAQYRPQSLSVFVLSGPPIHLYEPIDCRRRPLTNEQV